MDSLAQFNALPADAATAALLGWCASPRWAQRLADGRPYRSLADLLAASEAAFDDLEPADWQAAFAVHSRIGEPRAGDPREAVEQAGVRDADEELLRRANQAYEARFGHIFLIRAAGLNADQLLAAVHARMSNSAAQELAITQAQERQIVALRLRAALAAP